MVIAKVILLCKLAIKNNIINQAKDKLRKQASKADAK